MIKHTGNEEEEKAMPHKEVSAEARKSALESDYAALYAVAGITDALAEALKGALAETQQKASKRIGELQNKRPELSKQAEELRTFVITLPEQFKTLPESTRARIAELQRQANDLLAQATSAYGDYAGRGKQAVDEVRESARGRSGRASKPVTPRSTAKTSEIRKAPAKKAGAGKAS
jgi:hypothetical protein